MIKKDIIYENLTRLLQKLTPEGADLEAYGNNLSEEKQNILTDLSENIRVEFDKILASQRTAILHTDFESLIAFLQDFKSSFGDFPDSRVDEIILLVLLISKLNDDEMDEIDLSEDLEVTDFILMPLIKPIHVQNYVYIDPINLLNSIVLFDLTDLAQLIKEFEKSIASPELYFHVISKIGTPGNTLTRQKYVLVKADLERKVSSVWAYLTLNLVKNGKYFHKPSIYQALPSLPPNKSVISGKTYQQFQDTLAILSEYNHQTDILDKFLRLYHVFENFMYKHRLVELENPGNVFSLRDFQIMYEKVKGSEINALKSLMSKIVKLERSPGNLYKTFLHDRFLNLVNSGSVTQNNFNFLLEKLRIVKNEDQRTYLKYDDVTDVDIFYKWFAHLIYSFRNSIVHNRETEFHLNNETLLHHPAITDTANTILKSFLIPVMEELIFFLIMEPNNIVWFQGNTLMLWEE